MAQDDDIQGVDLETLGAQIARRVTEIEERDAAAQNSNMEERLRLLKHNVTLVVIDFVRMGLFEKDKLTVLSLVTLRIMVEDGLLENAASVGAMLRGGLERELGGVAGVKDIRGAGLMLGVELDRPCGVLLTRAMEAGLLLSVTADSVIRLVPPLIMTAAEAEEVVARLAPLVKNFLSEPRP